MRVVSLWLPHWQTDLCRTDSRTEPFALVAAAAGSARLAAVSPEAARRGLAPGMTLADARALVPGLATRPAEPLRAARALDQLADWALRFTPRAATSGDGLMLDVSGCAHLFGGEDALLARLLAGVRRQRLHARAALADTPGAAWAVARFGPGGVVPAHAAKVALAELPVAALRIDAATAHLLARVGLRRVGDLYVQPRAPLAARFAPALRRLDQALGRVPEPLALRRLPPAYEARRAFAEPVADAASIGAALDDLLAELCAGLERAGRGARRLVLTLFCLDGAGRAFRVGTSRPQRDRSALARLFTERLDGLEAGAGIEVIALAATATDPLPARQLDLEGSGDDGAALADLVDRIANRLGPRRVMRLGPRPSHLPDRAVARRDPLAEGTRAWPAAPPRPVRLLSPPVPVEAVAAVPDGPPLLFRWRGRVHRVARASGPERIAEEWWREDERVRDYYRVEDETGARYWLYREGLYDGTVGADAPRWYLDGLFA